MGTHCYKQSYRIPTLKNIQFEKAVSLSEVRESKIIQGRMHDFFGDRQNRILPTYVHLYSQISN